MEFFRCPFRRIESVEARCFHRSQIQGKTFDLFQYLGGLGGRALHEGHEEHGQKQHAHKGQIAAAHEAVDDEDHTAHDKEDQEEPQDLQGDEKHCLDVSGQPNISPSQRNVRIVLVLSMNGKRKKSDMLPSMTWEDV